MNARICALIVAFTTTGWFTGLAQEPVVNGRTLSEWVALTSASQPVVRQDACLALGNLREQAAPAVPALAIALRDPDPNVRQSAAFALYFIGSPARNALEDLEGALKDSDPGVRSMAAMTLGAANIRAARSVPALQAALKDPDATVRLYAQTALDGIRGAASSPVGGGIGTLPGGSGGSGGIAKAPQPDATIPAAPAVSPVTPRSQPAPAAPQTSSLPKSPPPPSKAPLPSRRDNRVTTTQPKLTYDGRALEEWIAQLDSKDVGQRRAAAAAIGELGPKARAAIGPLNRLRLYDEHDMVRHQAALALARILGLALGDLLPKPPAAKPAVPQGRLFYIQYLHDVSEEGITWRQPFVVEPGHRLRPHTMVVLNYLDLTEASKYRRDAKSRGLDVSKRLEQLVESDPAAGRGRVFGANPATEIRGKLFRPYDHDYIVRISWSGHTTYSYHRWMDGQRSFLGGTDDYLPLEAGAHDADIVIWTEEGFRLEFRLPYTAPAIRLGDTAIHDPAEIAPDPRRRLASLYPNDPATRYERAGLIKDIAFKEATFLSDRLRLDPPNPEATLRFIRDEFSLRRELARLETNYSSSPVTSCATLTNYLRHIPGRESLRLAAEITAFAGQFLGIPTLSPGDRAQGYAQLAECHDHLADIAIAVTMDVDACRAFLLAAHAHDQEIPASISSFHQMDVAHLVQRAPQSGWWNPNEDENHPTTVAAILQSGGAGVESGTGRGEVTHAPSKLSAAAAKALDDALAEVDEKRAAEVSWLIAQNEALGAANARMEGACGKLAVLRKSLASIATKRDRFEMLLRNEAIGMEDEDWTAEWLTGYLQKNAGLDEKVAGRTKGGTSIREALQQMIAQMTEREAALERERDQIVQETLLDYQAVIQSLKTKGPSSAEPAVAEVAAAMQKEAETRQKLVKANLFAFAGQDTEFREAAREAMSVGAEAEYQIRLLESGLLQKNGQTGAAWRAIKLAMEASGEDERGAKITLADGTTTWEPTPASQALREIELYRLAQINEATGRGADMIRRLGNQALGGHGEQGATAAIYDFFLGSFGSAAGEDSVLVPVYEALRWNSDFQKRSIDFVTGGWRRLGSKAEAIKAVGDLVDWVQDNAAKIKYSDNNYWSGTPVEGEDRRGGKPMSQAREMGTVLDDASQTCLGVMLIAQLRKHDVPLSQIATMTREDYKRLVAEKFDGHQLSDERALKLWSLIHYAMQQPDVARLVEGKPQVLDAEAGRGYYGDAAESLQPGWRDMAESQFSVFNMLLMTLPNARISSAGRKAGLWNWLNPTGEGAASSVMVKEAVSEAAGLPAVFEWMSRHEMGRRLMTDFVQTTGRMTVVGRAGLDFIVQTNATLWSRYAVEAAVEASGGDAEAQEKAGRAAELIAQIGTSFGLGDVDVTRRLANRALITRWEADEVNRILQSALSSANEEAALAEPYQKLLDRLRPKLDSAGQLPPIDQVQARDAVKLFKEQLDKLALALPAPAHAHPVVNKYYYQLAGLYNSLQATSEGMPVQAKLFSEVADKIGEKLDKAADLPQYMRAVQNAAGQRQNMPSVVAGNKVEWRQEDFDFNMPSRVPEADRLFRECLPRQAADLYAAAFYVFDEKGLLGDPAALRLALRSNVARAVADEVDQLALKRRLPDRNIDLAKPIPPEEITRLRNAPGLKFERIYGSLTEPFWVSVGGRRLFIAKPFHPQAPNHAMLAEIACPEVARKLGANPPASAKTTLPLDLDVEGKFARYFEAGESVPFRGSTNDDISGIMARGYELTPIGPEAPDACWVVSAGKRVGIFAPKQAGAFLAGEPPTVFGQIVRRSGGQVLDVVDTTMHMKEVGCVLVRFAEGEALMNFSDFTRVALKKRIAASMVARLILGDHDGHANNYLVTPNGQLVDIDWNLADVLESNRIPNERLYALFSPDELKQIVRKGLEDRLEILRGGVDKPMYRAMGPAAAQMTYKDFIDATDIAKKWDEKTIRGLLGDAYGPQTDRAIKIIIMRIGLLDEVLGRAYPQPKLRKSASVEFPEPRRRMRTDDSELALAA